MMKSLFGVGILAMGGLAIAEPSKGPDAKAVFTAMKQLEGKWTGKSQSGMQEALETKLIGGGVVLMETSSLNMATMYHMDGNRVLLTHYCEAMNQPRLRAASISPDKKKVTFVFIDGTNMKSPNAGHMHRVVFDFIDKDTYRSKWTWFQNGKEKWMEDFTFHRVNA